MKLFHFVNNTVVLKPGGYQCLLSCYGNAPSKNSVFGPLSSVVLSQNFSKEVKLDSPLPPSFLKYLMVMKLSLLFFNSLFKKKHLNFASKNRCCYFVEVNLPQSIGRLIEDGSQMCSFNFSIQFGWIVSQKLQMGSITSFVIPVMLIGILEKALSSKQLRFLFYFIFFRREILFFYFLFFSKKKRDLESFLKVFYQGTCEREIVRTSAEKQLKSVIHHQQHIWLWIIRNKMRMLFGLNHNESLLDLVKRVNKKYGDRWFQSFHYTLHWATTEGIGSTWWSSNPDGIQMFSTFSLPSYLLVRRRQFEHS